MRATLPSILGGRDAEKGRWQAAPPAPPCQGKPLQASSPGGFLCLGFLRTDLGTMGLEAGTRPTRSRAMALISLPRSNAFFLRGKHLLHQGSQHLRSERFRQKDGAL